MVTPTGQGTVDSIFLTAHTNTINFRNVFDEYCFGHFLINWFLLTLHSDQDRLLRTKNTQTIVRTNYRNIVSQNIFNLPKDFLDCKKTNKLQTLVYCKFLFLICKINTYRNSDLVAFGAYRVRLWKIESSVGL